MKKLTAAFWLSVAAAIIPSLGFAWGHEGHQIVALIAEKNTTPTALARAQAILGGASLEDVASWADDYRRDHPETAPWHYIDIPLADSKIDMAHECPDGQCVIAQTERFLSVLKDPKADRAAKAEALRFVVHFMGDLHQPLQERVVRETRTLRDVGGSWKRAAEISAPPRQFPTTPVAPLVSRLAPFERVVPSRPADPSKASL